MDIFKSLWPLILALSPQQSNVLVRLRQRRSKLAAEVTDLINTLGPEMFPDFEHTRIIHDPSTEQNGPWIPRKTHQREDSIGEHITLSEPITPTSPSFTNVNLGGRSSANGHLPRNESFKNLSNIGLFASRPGTPHHMRSRSRTNSTGGLPIQGFSSLDTNEDFDEVTKKIRGAMRERSQRRKSESDKADWESGYSTPTSEGPEGLGMAMSANEGKKDA
jgi:glycerol-3-phosphate O-acyltransferase/dihydroxyacetone phosphate acyltransferase